MTAPKIDFNDGEAYERLMGRWSGAVGAQFLEWLAPPQGARWLDLGCGTGVFTEMVLNNCTPAAITAIDPSAAQIEFARKQPVASNAEFQVGDAQALPFPDGTFDVVASALVINFIPDRRKGLAEMRRVARRSGVVAGYVWDFAGGRGSSWPVTAGLKALGLGTPGVPGLEDTPLDRFRALFKGAGLEAVEVRAIEITVQFPNFEEYWRDQAPAFSPAGKIVAALPEANRAKLKDKVREIVKPGADGRIAYPARAHAAKARVPR